MVAPDVVVSVAICVTIGGGTRATLASPDSFVIVADDPTDADLLHDRRRQTRQNRRSTRHTNSALAWQAAKAIRGGRHLSRADDAKRIYHTAPARLRERTARQSATINA